ncbi:MAG TPA: hypothetical protein VKU90_14960, partial [Caulobacteraceae bacterium]|nr:hypothetical protein [Caulobacteraceae bacterium]
MSRFAARTSTPILQTAAPAPAPAVEAEVSTSLAPPPSPPPEPTRDTPKDAAFFRDDGLLDARLKL